MKRSMRATLLDITEVTMRGLAVVLIVLLAPLEVGGAELPIFDAHVHYSHDAWQSLPPKEAVALLRQAGVRRALVSSSGDEGTRRLHGEAPDLIAPALRPYRRRGEIGSWVRDETLVAYLEERLGTFRYVAIGEFHVYGSDADLPVVRKVVELARRHKLFLHAHADADAVERLFRQDPDARVLWAHAGFERPERVREMLRRHGNLWCDLAFRNDHAVGGKVDAEWRVVFVEFPDRFMVGTDTFSPERWHSIAEHANWSRGWLADLPPAVAERIAYRNGEALFGSPTSRQP
jgi:predicted TIM-barrel fold metal-dependent hydrolase